MGGCSHVPGEETFQQRGYGGYGCRKGMFIALCVCVSGTGACVVHRLWSPTVTCAWVPSRNAFTANLSCIGIVGTAERPVQNVFKSAIVHQWFMFSVMFVCLFVCLSNHWCVLIQPTFWWPMVKVKVKAEKLFFGTSSREN